MPLAAWHSPLSNEIHPPCHTEAADVRVHLSMWPIQAWEVIHMAEQGAQVAVDTAKVFVDDVMNGVKVLVKIGGDIAHFVAQVLLSLRSLRSKNLLRCAAMRI